MKKFVCAALPWVCAGLALAGVCVGMFVKRKKV